MFDELIARIRRRQAELGFELNRVTDPYHLSGLLERYAEDYGHFLDETWQMVKELEEIDNDSIYQKENDQT